MSKMILDNALFHGGGDPAIYITRIHQQYTDFVLSLERLKHEQSYMMALFVKVATSYYSYSCNKSVHNCDFWLLEQESYAWVGPWKILDKTIYMALQCEAIEVVHNNKDMSVYL